MSLLSDLQALVESCGVSVETGVFSGKAPDTYLVITPLSDSFELHALLGADFYITDRRYIGFETETGYHHYAIDVAQIYELEV